MTSDPLLWFFVDNPPGHNIPRWSRSVALASDGTIFAPAAMTDDSEKAVFLKAGWDGNIPAVVDQGHVYLPTWWIAREYPEVADICGMMESKIKSNQGSAKS
jgi:hypothetical protein